MCLEIFLPTRPQSPPGQALSELSLGPGTRRGGQQDRQIVCGLLLSPTVSYSPLLPFSFSSFEELIVNYLSDAVNMFDLKNSFKT